MGFVETINEMLTKVSSMFEKSYYNEMSRFLADMNKNIEPIKKSALHFTESEMFQIEENFKNHDGYFTKLIYNNKILGYIFRATEKNVKIRYADDTTEIIPYLVTCAYLPMQYGMSIKNLKTLGKSHALKSGNRIVKFVAKNDCEKSTFKDFIKHALSIEEIFSPDYKYSKNKYPEFLNIEKEDYNNIIEYVNNFDEKIYKYYQEIDKNEIVTVWLRF